MTDTYQLPDLPYDYAALEPWCNAETLHLHHDKHHRAYVTAANAAVDELASLDPADKARRAGVEAALAFNLGGHVMHSLFWENLTPRPASPDDALGRLVELDFGSAERMRALLVAAGVGVQGSGWGALVYDPFGDRLHVAALHDHHRDLPPGVGMLAVVDVWEHAYYLGYRNDRAGWVEAAVDHLDWDIVKARLSTVALTT